MTECMEILQNFPKLRLTLKFESLAGQVVDMPAVRDLTLTVHTMNVN